MVDLRRSIDGALRVIRQACQPFRQPRQRLLSPDCRRHGHHVNLQRMIHRQVLLTMGFASACQHVNRRQGARRGWAMREGGSSAPCPSDVSTAVIHRVKAKRRRRFGFRRSRLDRSEQRWQQGRSSFVIAASSFRFLLTRKLSKQFFFPALGHAAMPLRLRQGQTGQLGLDGSQPQARPSSCSGVSSERRTF